MSSGYYDYQASLTKLSEKLREMRDSNWSPTPRVKELREFAAKLEKTAYLLNEQRWLSVETEFEKDPPPETGADGWPIPQDPLESRFGMYSATKWRLLGIAEMALQEAESYPDSRKKPTLPFGALAYIHIRYLCNKEDPILYDEGEDVMEFKKVCEDANIYLSNARLRTALGDALSEIKSGYTPDEIERLLVIKQ